MERPNSALDDLYVKLTIEDDEDEGVTIAPEEI